MPLFADIGGRTLRVGNALAGGHPVDFIWPYVLDFTQAVSMQYLSCEDIGDRGQAYVRMGADINACAGCEEGGAEVVKKDKGPHRRLLPGRQKPADAKTSEVFVFRFKSHSYSGTRVLGALFTVDISAK